MHPHVPINTVFIPQDHRGGVQTLRRLGRRGTGCQAKGCFAAGLHVSGGEHPLNFMVMHAMKAVCRAGSNLPLGGGGGRQRTTAPQCFPCALGSSWLSWVYNMVPSNKCAHSTGASAHEVHSCPLSLRMAMKESFIAKNLLRKGLLGINRHSHSDVQRHSVHGSTSSLLTAGCQTFHSLAVTWGSCWCRRTSPGSAHPLVPWWGSPGSSPLVRGPSSICTGGRVPVTDRLPSGQGYH